MANTYFEFQQFKVDQELCAMKVCTDACLFGAWVAHWIKERSQEPIHRIMDIGTGTGLLSLMLAQFSNANIDAVEIDNGAATQAKANFNNSKWYNRLSLIHAPIQLIDCTTQYDFIISNPPFYADDLKSSNDARNVALHSKALDFTELLLSIQALLLPNGNFAVLLPYSRSIPFVELAQQHGYFLQEEVRVQQTPSHPFFRSMLLFGANAKKVNTTTIIIKINQLYSSEFRQLLSPYYLPF